MAHLKSNGYDYQLLTMDLEASEPSNGKRRANGQQLGRIWRRPLPLRNIREKSSRVNPWITCVLTVICIFQAVWICRTYAGSRRISNDGFDKLFPRTITVRSPSIWDDDRQSFIHNATPVPIHSHNDERQRLPLFEALGSGCISVEADTHLVDGNLLVGHTSVGLRLSDNLVDMYLDPLLRMISNQNMHIGNGSLRGIYNHDPDQSLVLLIDHKSDGAATFDELYKQLQPLRDRGYLTYWNGTDRLMRPLTVVASGNAPFESVLALNASHRDIFWDAHLGTLSTSDDDFTVEPPLYKYNISNSYYASTSWANVTLFAWSKSMQWSSPRSKDVAAPQIEQARSRGLLPRYWDTPAGPPNMKEVIWKVLRGLNVYVICMDDMGVVRDRSAGWGWMGWSRTPRPYAQTF
ncbi:Altered inheritance of mitochondria protein 6 [Rhinocladiella similis]